VIPITVEAMAGRDDAAAVLRPPLAYRLTASQWLAIDCAVAALTAGLMLFGVGVLHGFRWHMPTEITAAWAMAVTPVAVRRIWPVPVLVAVTAAGCVLTAAGRAPVAVDVTLGMAIYTAAALCRRTTAVIVVVVTEAAFGAVFLHAADYSKSQTDAVRALLVAAALWFIGSSMRERRRYLAGLAEQAAQAQQAEAERSRQAVREERVRIARELHDVVAHSLSVVTVQAGVGRKVGSSQPGEALRALRAVEVTGRGTLEELRRILGLLRDDDTAELPSLSPAPGIENLGELADSVRAAGIPVGLAVTENAAVLPPATALTVYRIVQEALTNVVKHARSAKARVRVRTDPDGVRITVTDTGRGAADPVGGQGETAARHGIVGMRERAAAFGGTLDAGPLPGGGFQVKAFLPVPGPAAPVPGPSTLGLAAPVTGPPVPLPGTVARQPT
jgi:signal transduction histidine kinase